MQERRLAGQQVRERLDRVAAVTARDLDEELRRWQAAVDELVDTNDLAAFDASAVPTQAHWPERLRQAVESPAGAVLIVRVGQALNALPNGQLLYEPAASASSGREFTRLTGLDDARAAEVRDHDYARALRLYERMMATAEPADRAVALHGLARTARKAGAHERALRYYEDLAAAGDTRVGELPAELIARHEICALLAELGDAEALRASAGELYAGLVAGRWQLEKVRYLFYSRQAWQWLSAGTSETSTQGAIPASEIADLRALEQRKLALSATTASFVETPRRAVVTEDHLGLAFWNVDPFVALILPAETVKTLIWDPVMATVDEPGIALNLLGSDRTVLLGDGSPEDPSVRVTRELTAADASVRLQVWPADPAALQADLTRRQALYLAMLTLVLTLLAFGSYLTVRMTRQEVEMARLKARFVSAVSHEFRSPLTGIRQLAEMLLRDRVPNEERKQSYYRMIARESSRLTRLVENVLDFSRIEEQRREYADESVDTNDWLAEVVGAFEQEIEDQGVTVTTDIAARLPAIRGDREALTCAIHNLLDNAVKYSPGAETVWLDAAATDGGLSLRVRDDGIGISEQDRRRVFAKFFRSADKAADEVKGVGLGLSLVQHIVAAHGGTIGVESAPGDGSTFTVELPAVTPSAKAMAHTPEGG